MEYKLIVTLTYWSTSWQECGTDVPNQMMVIIKRLKGLYAPYSNDILDALTWI